MAVKERLARMSENDRRVESQILVRELRKILAEMNPKTIGVYIPFKDEPDIRPLVQELLDDGKIVGMPVMKKNGLHFVTIESLDNIGRDEANIPTSDAEALDETTLDIVIVPGRAFTDKGDRMGRGNGGYDHWIMQQRKRNAATIYIGVGFDCQWMKEMPVEAHDEKLDMVLTPSKTIKCDLQAKK